MFPTAISIHNLHILIVLFYFAIKKYSYWEFPQNITQYITIHWKVQEYTIFSDSWDMKGVTALIAKHAELNLMYIWPCVIVIVEE